MRLIPNGEKSRKLIFLIDGIGAIVTAGLLTLVVARFESLFGMDSRIAYALAAAALFLAVISLTCFALNPQKWKTFLLAIAVLNTVYCITTLSLVVYLSGSLNWLGISYFLGEVVIIMALVMLEWRIIDRGANQ
ncbi:MAG: hypothetical protein DWQ47_17545 [Acidobacteria bacterium]|nr:MAG: hypothetical protein DWQ32_04945 [Acidobacteriota bacterium]REK02156.1 MAG: hypothetical protein DWQ38_07210 [Acidobacteriota bacterium]REK14042.1 MAG: hypothetical protein DWQ43_10635 [Acidobacteriota bacterium]REK42037.1 MAG: hypothetical protein DWQ47_17545 [Acidobacteriota bacterium]